MDKLTMAHDWYMKHADGANTHMNLEIGLAWKYADAMQAEADKRNYSEKQDSSEWQPDWSQAPSWANWWAMDSNGDSYWHSCVDEPFVNGLIFEIANPQGHTFDAPSFDYQGNWQDSLRKRPQ